MSPGGTSRNQLLALTALAVCGLLVLYAWVPYTYSHLLYLTSVFGALRTMWGNFPDFQHGMLVPPILVAVIYFKRKELAAIPVKGWWPGIVLVVLSLAVYWIGRRVDNQYLGFFSLQALLGSLVLWMLGWRWLVGLAFPLAFLTFAWPLPFLDIYVSFPLQMVMSSVSTHVLNAFGIPVIQNGSGILSADNPALGIAAGSRFQLDVAKACSGIRSLYALMMVSALYAYFSLKSPWKRALLFLASIPLAVIGNLCRILVLTFGVITLGAPAAIGPPDDPSWFHETAGFAIFVVALCGMLLVHALLNSPRAGWRNMMHLIAPPSNTNLPLPEKQESRADIY